MRKVGDQFHIIAGERRWRAAQKAGLLRVPVVVREIQPGNERAVLEMALIENIQRENLNPIEEALAYRRLGDEFQMTQEQIAGAVGKDRATVANFVRLLKLPDEVRADVAAGSLSMGHARALLALPSEADQRRVARDVVNRSLSVRETESIVRKATDEKRRAKEAADSEAGRRAHARRGGASSPSLRYARADRAPGRQGAHRDRFRVRGRIDPAVRPVDDEN